MDLIEGLRLLSSRIANTKNLIQTEEATKNAMVMPFIQLLGYNVFDPLEVTPELVADVGTKKGEKVDYAILREGKPIILFECKKSGGDLSINHAGQLFRYFHVTEARFGVLATRLIELGVKVVQDLARLDVDSGPVTSAQPLCVVAVDNLALRKSLDKVRGAAVLEAGIGDGVDGFTRVQAHAFPGRRQARDILVGEDPKASRAVDISKPAYQSLLKECGDECGTTLVAGRSIATPFVGAFAGALLARLSSSGELQEHAWNFDVNSL